MSERVLSLSQVEAMARKPQRASPYPQPALTGELAPSAIPQSGAVALSVTSTDDAILTAARQEAHPEHFVQKMANVARRAYELARLNHDSGYVELDTKFQELQRVAQSNSILRRPDGAPLWTSVFNATLTFEIRTWLQAIEFFSRYTGPKMTAADWLVRQPVPTSVHVHRLGGNVGGPHPLEPKLPVQNEEVVRS